MFEFGSIKEMFETTRFSFAVFRDTEDDIEMLTNIVFWSMPTEIIEKE